jgi:hypothetical protein
VPPPHGNHMSEAVELRDRAAVAARELNQARAAVAPAQAQDRAEHAERIVKDAGAALRPTHAEAAQRRVEELERRHMALATATESATDRLLDTAEGEAEKVADAARRSRERSAEAVREATAVIVAAVDQLEAATGASRWAADPAIRRWWPALKVLEFGSGPHRSSLAQAIRALQELPAVLEDQRTPDEEQPEPGIRFGWPAAGNTVNIPGVGVSH